MPDFNHAINLVLGHEGWSTYTNDPRDSGGATRYGISQKAYPNEDIKNLTLERAVFLYKRDYWDKCRCDEMPAWAALLVFDAAVNQGVTKSITFAQMASGAGIDGKVGPNTLASINRTPKQKFIEDFCARRLAHYMTLDGIDRTYGFGWARRVMKMAFEASNLS